MAVPEAPVRVTNRSRPSVVSAPVVTAPVNRWVSVIMGFVFVGVGAAAAVTYEITDAIAVWALALVFFVGSYFIDRGP